MSPKRSTKDRLRFLLKVTYALLVVFYIAILFLLPEQLNAFVLWMNTPIENGNYILDAVRAATAIATGLSMYKIGELLLKFPTKKRFYLFFAPLPFAMLYYLSQIFVVTSEVIPRKGFLLMNLSGSGVMATIAVMAGIISYLYREENLTPNKPA